MSLQNMETETTPSPLQLKCAVCLKSFNSTFNFTVHKEVYSRRNLFRLRSVRRHYCPSNILLLKTMMKHVKNRTHKCDLCNKAFNSKGNLIRHMSLFEHGIQKSKFGLLNKYFEVFDIAKDIPRSLSKKEKTKEADEWDDDELAKNVRVHLSDLPFECIACSKKFRYKCDVMRHVRAHTGEKPYFCTFCDQTFNFGGNLNKHIRRVHKGAHQIDTALLKRSKTDNTGSPTADRNRKISKKRNNRVRKIAHRRQKQSKSKVVAVTFECDVCSQRFENKTVLRRHLRTHDDGRLFKCSVCQKGFKSNFTLDKHMTTFHKSQTKNLRRTSRNIKRGYKNKYKDFVLLDSESELDEGEESSVQTSPKATMKKKTMNSDKKSSSGDKSLKLKCTVCPKQFRYKSDLDRHILAHTGEKPFTCPFCSKTYTHSGHMNKHIKTAHDENFNPRESKFDFTDVSDEISGDEEFSEVEMTGKSKGKKGSGEKTGSSSAVVTRKRGRPGKVVKQKPVKRRLISQQEDKDKSGEKRPRKRNKMDESDADGDDNELVGENSFEEEATGSLSPKKPGKRSGNGTDKVEVTGKKRYTYRCPECYQHFNFVSNFYKHMHRMHKELSVPRNRNVNKTDASGADCNDIEFASGYEDETTDSLAVLLSPKKEKNHCGEASYIVIGAGKKLYRCSECRQKFNYVSNYYKHMQRMHKEFSVPRTRHSVKKAVCNKTINLEVIPADQSDNGRRMFRCSECGYTSNITGNLYKHMRRVHLGCTIEKSNNPFYFPGDDKVIKVIKSSPEEIQSGKLLYQCSICIYMSNFSSNLYKHFRRKHMDFTIESSRKFPCKVEPEEVDTKMDTTNFTELLLPEGSPTKEIHKIVVNNRKVSVLMHQHDSNLGTKSANKLWSLQDTLKKKVANSLWSFEDTIIKKPAIIEDSQEMYAIKQPAIIEESQEGYTIKKPAIIDEIQEGYTIKKPVDEESQETYTIILDTDGTSAEMSGGDDNEPHTVTILIDQEGEVETKVDDDNNEQTVTIYIDQEDTLEQRVAESLLNLSAME